MVPGNKVIVMLSPETMGVLRALVSDGEFHTLSEAVRSIIDDYAEERLQQGVVPAPEHGDDALCINDLTIDGSSLDGAVRAAARSYIREKTGIGE